MEYRKDGALPNEGPIDQNTLIIWVSPQHGNSIMAMRRESPSYTAQVECEMQNVEGYGWFPSRAIFTRWDEDKMNRREELDIKVHQLNETIESTFFEFGGMGVPDAGVIRADE